MDNLFLNSENSQTSEPHILILRLTNNLYLRAVINLKYQLQHEMESLNYLANHILYHKKFTDNPPVRIYVNKTESRITFKMKTGYYLKLLMSESMKLVGSSKSKLTKIKMWRLYLV